MRMQEAVGLSFLNLPLVCTSKPPKAHLSQWLPARFHSETVVQEPLVTFRCPHSTTHPCLLCFQSSSGRPPSLCTAWSQMKGSDLSLGTDMWLTHSSSPSPSWDPIFYTRGVPTWGQLGSCLLERWLHYMAQPMPTFPLPWFCPHFHCHGSHWYLTGSGCLAFRAPYLLFFKPGQPPTLFQKMAFLEWIKKPQYIYTMDYYSAIKRNESE